MSIRDMLKGVLRTEWIITVDENGKRHKVCEEDERGIPGLSLRFLWITPDEELTLLREIDAQPWNTTLKRRTQHYGFTYDYSSKVLAAATPMPTWCDFIIRRLLDQEILRFTPDQMIVNEYEPGQGIYPHVDAVDLFEDGIVSLSLGSRVIMDLTRASAGPPVEIGLDRRSLVVFHGDARYKWRHGIASRKADHGTPRSRRVSLTFRKVKDVSSTRKVVGDREGDRGRAQG
jgi:alkylated DNA repair dioxygenase AlkB